MRKLSSWKIQKGLGFRLGAVILLPVAVLLRAPPLMADGPVLTYPTAEVPSAASLSAAVALQNAQGPGFSGSSQQNVTAPPAESIEWLTLSSAHIFLGSVTATNPLNTSEAKITDLEIKIASVKNIKGPPLQGADFIKPWRMSAVPGIDEDARPDVNTPFLLFLNANAEVTHAINLAYPAGKAALVTDPRDVAITNDFRVLTDRNAILTAVGAAMQKNEQPTILHATGLVAAAASLTPTILTIPRNTDAGIALGATGISTLTVPSEATGFEPQQLITACVQRTLFIRPGLTRGEVEANFSHDGGLSSVFHNERFILPLPPAPDQRVCMINIEFKPFLVPESVYRDMSLVTPFVQTAVPSAVPAGVQSALPRPDPRDTVIGKGPPFLEFRHFN